jgi:hypothetical protein
VTDAAAQTDDAAPRVKLLKGARTAPEEPTRRIYFTSASGNEREWHLVRQRLANVGAWRINGFFPDVIVCELPVSVDPWRVLEGTSLTATPREAMSDARAEAGPPRLKSVRRAYQKIDARRKQTPPIHQELPHSTGGYYDREPALVPVPAVPLPRTGNIRDAYPDGAFSLAQTDDAPLYYQNTEFLAGNVLVRIVFPESRGGQQEDWSQEGKDGAVTTIKLAMDYFDRHFRNVDLNFDYNSLVLETEYEPINMSLDDDQIRLWIDDILTREGYNDPVSVKEKVHQFNENLHQHFTSSDWVFTVFVVNAENDYDHFFPDSRTYARAELGGPFMIVPYSTATEDFVEDLFLHAMVQVFWGTWEDVGPWGCSTNCGYLNVQNGNKNNPDPLGALWDCTKDNPVVECIAEAWVVEGALYGFPYDGPPCEFTFGQLGYIDENRNSVPDVFDSPPAVTFRTAWPETLVNFSDPIRFTVTAQAVQNRNSEAAKKGPLRHYATPIDKVEYSLNNGPPSYLNPVDGEDPDEPQEEYEIALSFLLPGMSSVDVAATNTYAAKSQYYSKNIFYIGLDYYSFRIEYPNVGVGIAWYLRGNTFDARLKLLRIDYGVEPAAVDTVAWPDDLQPVGVPRDGLTPYYFLDKSVEPGRDYGYAVEGDFELFYRPEQRIKTFTSVSNEIGTFAPLPRESMMSDPAPNPLDLSEDDKTVVSINVPGAMVLPLFSSRGGPARAAGQSGMGDAVEPISLTVSVYDVAGRRIRELFDDRVYEQVKSVDWDGRNYKGDLVPTGMYFIKAQSGDLSDAKKVLIIR